MNLIFKENNIEILNIDFNNIVTENIIFGEDKVKEISITHITKNGQDKTLKDVYKLLENLNKNDITEVVVYYNDQYQIKYNIPIENFYYRICDYSKKGDIKLLENLSIRFIEDNKIIFNPIKNMIFCDIENCKYSHFNFCLKHKKELNVYNNNEYIVCYNCFLDMWPSIGSIVYKTMQKFYSQKEE